MDRYEDRRRRKLLTSDFRARVRSVAKVVNFIEDFCRPHSATPNLGVSARPEHIGRCLRSANAAN